DELAEHRSRDVLHAARTRAGRTPLGLGARLGAGAAARRTGDADRKRDLALRPVRGLDEVDLDLGDRVRAAGTPPAAPDAEEVVAEEGREEIGEAAEVECRGVEAAAAQALVPVPVVELARLRLREDLVGLDDLPETLLGVRLLRDVRVERSGEPAERFLDLALTGGALDAEDLVVVALRRCHQSQRTRRSSCPRRSPRRTGRARARLRAPTAAPCRSPCARGRAG